MSKKTPKIHKTQAPTEATPRPSIPRTLPIKPGREETKVVTL